MTAPAANATLNTSKPTFSGTAGQEGGDVPAVTVKIYAGSTASGSPIRSTVVASSAGNWSTSAFAALNTDGTYTVQTEQSDEAGNTGTSTAVTFTIDTTPPTVTLTTPAANATLNITKPTFSGSAGQASGDESSVTLKIYAGSTASGSPIRSTVVTSSAGNWSTSAFAALNTDGTYTARAEQSDEADNTGKSTPVTFTIDTTPPTVTLTTPAANATLNISKPTFSGAAGQASGDEHSVTLKIYEGSTASGSPTQTDHVTPSGGNWSTGPISALANGTYTAQAEQADAVGNTGTSTVTFTITTSAPVVKLQIPGLIARGAQHVTGSTPSFAGTGSTAPEDGKTVMVDVYTGEAASGVPVRTLEGSLTGSSWSVGPVAALAEGTYTVQARQSDSDFDGLPGLSEASTFTVDATAPVVTLTSPTKGSSTTSEFESFNGAAGGAPGDQSQITVKLFAGASIASQGPLKEVTVPVKTGSWSAAFGGLSSGTYTARAQQSDDVHNTGVSLPVTFTVKLPTPSTPAVTPSASTPPPPPVASFQWFPLAPHTGEPISLISTSTDVAGSIAGFAWSLTGGGTFTAGGPTLTTSFATPGNHAVALRVTDTDGRSSVVTESIPVTTPRPTLMRPFPVVRIAGSENASGVKIGLLTVLAPIGSTVTVSCHGRGCPPKAENVLATSKASKSKAGTVLIAFRRFQRSLRAGTILQIKVSAPGQIGKYTRFSVRHGKLPTRVDMCLSSTGLKPIVCPSS